MTSKRRTSTDALLHHPITRGDVIAVGPHQVSCLDVEESATTLLDLMRDRPIRLLYVDPPWGGSIYAHFRREAQISERDYKRFQLQLVRLAAVLGQPIVLEMGKRWTPHWLTDLSTATTWPAASVEGVYFGNKPMDYLVCAPSRAQIDAVHDAIRGADDSVAPGLAMDALGLREGDGVLDPCCGRGLTSHHAVERGLIFSGNEQTPYRAAATLRFLRTGEKGA